MLVIQSLVRVRNLGASVASEFYSDGLRLESENRFSESDGLIRSPSESVRSPSEVRQLPTAFFLRRTPKTSDGLRSDSSDVRLESVGLQSDFSESE